MKTCRLYISIFAVGVILFFSNPVYASEEIRILKDSLDIIFITDYSGSMNANDKERMALEMVKAFIEITHSEDIRIGYVAYNDRILSSTSPLPISSAEERNALKKIIDTPAYSGNTDIGLGVHYAFEMLTKETDRRKVMILISDGESDLEGSETGRDMDTSNQDLEYTLNRCKAEGIPIFTVAFGKYGGSKETLENIAKQTDAAMYMAEEPESLIEILFGIFENNLTYNIENIADGIYSKDTKSIHYLLKEPYIDEMVVFMVSEDPMDRVKIYYGETELIPEYIKHYAVAKITEVKDNIDEITIQMTTKKEQRIKAYLICYRNLIPIMELDLNAEKKKDIPFSVHFKNKEGERIVDKGFYESFEWKIQIKNQEYLQLTIPLKTTIEENGFTGIYFTEKSGNYILDCSLYDKFESCSFEPVIFEVANHKPVRKVTESGSFSVLRKAVTFDLDEWFTDVDGDQLSYRLDSETYTHAEVELNGTQIMIQGKKAGEEIITIWVSDGETEIPFPYQIHVSALLIWLIITLILMLVASSIIFIIMKWKYMKKKIKQ